MSLHCLKQLAKSVCSVAESAIKQSLSKAGQKLWDKGWQSQINKHVVYCLPFFPLCRPTKCQAKWREMHLCTFCEYKIAPWMYILLSFFNKKRHNWMENRTPALTVWASLESRTWLHSLLPDTQRTGSGNCKWQMLQQREKSYFIKPRSIHVFMAWLWLRNCFSSPSTLTSFRKNK